MSKSDLPQLFKQFDLFLNEIEPGQRSRYEQTLEAYMRDIISSHWVTRKRGVSDEQQRPVSQGGGQKTVTQITFICPCCKNNVDATFSC